ncbi:hypothetical protein L204_102598 [Cryptococcus depauperatus]
METTDSSSIKDTTLQTLGNVSSEVVSEEDRAETSEAQVDEGEGDGLEASGEISGEDNGEEKAPAAPEESAPIFKAEQNGHGAPEQTVEKDITGLKDKPAEPTVVNRDDKQKENGVRKILKSGVFGTGVPKPTPSRISVGTAASNRLSRPSLAPARTANDAKSMSATAKARPVPTPARPGHTIRLSTSGRPAATGTSSTVKPTSTTASAQEARRSGTSASDRTTSSGTARPASASVSGTGVTKRPTVTKPSVPSAASSRTVAKTGVVRPAASSASNAAKKPEPATSTTTNRISRPSTTSSAFATTRRLAAQRAGTSGTGTVVKPGITRPAAGRTSLAPSSVCPAADVAQIGAAGSVPSVINNDKETVNLKAKIEELEKSIEEEKGKYEEKIARLIGEKKEIEESHAQAVEKIQNESSTTTSSTGTDFEAQISELKALHETQLRAADEEKSAVMKEMTEKLQKLGADYASTQEQLAVANSQFSQSTSELETLKSSLKIAEDELSQLRSLTASQESALSEIQTAKTELATRLDNLEQEKQNLEKKITEKEQETNKSLTDGSGLRDRISELEEKITVLEGVLQREKDERKGDEGKWAEEKAALEQELETLRTEHTEHLEVSKRVSSHADASREELDAMRTAHNQLSTTYAELVEISSRHPEAVADLQKQLNDASSKHEALLLEAAQGSQSTITTLEDEVATLKKEKSEREKEVKEKIDQLAQIGKELETLKQARQESKEKEKNMEQIIENLEKKIEQSNAESEAKYAVAFENAKQTANQEHQQELASIRKDLAATHSQLQAAHQSELDSLKASHATTLSSLGSDHNTAINTLELSLKAANAQIEQDKAKLEEILEEKDHIEEEVRRLKGEAENAKKLDKDGDSEVEEELKRVKAELQHVSDELTGAKEVAEMNKAHFEQTLFAMQQQQQEDAAGSAEQKAEESAQLKNKYETQMENLRGQIKNLRIELEDERVEKNSLVAKLAASTRTPPTSPSTKKPSSPSITRLHEAHNLKVSELENEIARLKAQIAGKPFHEDSADETGENVTF